MREGVGFGDYVLAFFGKNSQREWKIVKPTSRQWVRGRFYRSSTQGAPQSSTDGERANHCKRKINTITMDKHATDRRAHTRGHGDGRGGGRGWGGGRKLSRHPTPPRPASKAPGRLIKLRITNSDDIPIIVLTPCAGRAPLWPSTYEAAEPEVAIESRDHTVAVNKVVLE